MNVLAAAIVMLCLVDLIRYRKKLTLDAYLKTQNLWFRWGVSFGLILLIFVYGKYGAGYDPQQFIYFQF